MSKIGIFMGSFDPPHIGHIGVVTAALNSKYVDTVIVIPAWKNLWKKNQTPFIDRFNMCVKSFLPIGLSVKVSSIEESLSINHPDGVPSYKTIEYFQMKFPKDELYIIVTAETLSEIPNWKFGDKILKENKFIITSGGKDVYIDETPKGTIIVCPPLINMCSTWIRNELKHNKYVYPYIIEDVVKYINEYNLYK